MPIDIIKASSPPLRRLDSNGRALLVTAAHAAANREAEEILDAAKRTAERLIAAARDEASRLAADARVLAERDGARRWMAAAVDLARAGEASAGTVEREAVDLAMEVARRIVGDAVSSSADTWADLVAKSTERLRRDARLVIRHSTDDGDRIEAVRLRLASFREVAFESDESLQPGDCIAECEGVRVDARLDVQLAAIERLLVEPTPELSS